MHILMSLKRFVMGFDIYEFKPKNIFFFTLQSISVEVARNIYHGKCKLPKTRFDNS